MPRHAPTDSKNSGPVLQCNVVSFTPPPQLQPTVVEQGKQETDSFCGVHFSLSDLPFNCSNVNFLPASTVHAGKVAEQLDGSKCDCMSDEFHGLTA